MYNSLLCRGYLNLKLRQFTTAFTVNVRNGLAKADCFSTPRYVGHYSSRLMLPVNEDRYSMGFLSTRNPGDVFNSPEIDQVFAASVFDGHGGTQTAQFLQEHLYSYLESSDTSSLRETLPAEYSKLYGGYWDSFNWGSARLDESNLSNKSRISKETSELMALYDRLKLAYLKADLDVMALDKFSGSTCTSVYLSTKSKTVDPMNKSKQGQMYFWSPNADVDIITAQIGDSKTLVCDQQGNHLALTRVHHAENTREQKRLHDFSEYLNSTIDGRQRFMQYLNTRAFGDSQAKGLGISAEPELREYKIVNGRGRLSGNDAFIALCSDGVTDSISSQEICDLVISMAASGGTAQQCAESIVNYSLYLGAVDNATAIIIRLGAWGDWKWKDRTLDLRTARLQKARTER
ncbi:type 2C protein phosphatase [Starmerella bacillaris]|uniref:Type 2C protein phosphatase n=1 Tax=Starmerella bacillaris TaxID=1247836 RepID=A0AAV5RN55_STABA|nr:type 2C protein phosphatase [Starmerella bacillaris]